MSLTTEIPLDDYRVARISRDSYADEIVLTVDYGADADPEDEFGAYINLARWEAEAIAEALTAAVADLDIADHD